MYRMAAEPAPEALPPMAVEPVPGTLHRTAAVPALAAMYPMAAEPAPGNP
jgi:hypothetical protein